MARKTPKVRGEVHILPLSSVRPNDWNPNVMTGEDQKSLKEGLRAEGWLVSQALLIWGSDEDGTHKNLIIDGEHRWKCAMELKMTEGPMVVLEKISRQQAIALTVKLDQIRGKFDQDLLGKAIREIVAGVSFEAAGLGKSLGFSADQILVLTSQPTVLPPSTGSSGGGEAKPPGDFPDLNGSTVKTEHRCPRCSYEW